MILNDAVDVLLGEEQCERIFLGDQTVWSRSGQRTKVGILPYTFHADGNNLIDWQLTALWDNYGAQRSNRLEYKPIADGDLTNAVDPEQYPDVFGYIYTSSDSNSSSIMNRYTHIPSGTPTGEDYQRWYRIVAPYNDYWHRINDYRGRSYNRCNWFATLEPGSYKLVVECANPYGYYLPQNNPNPTMNDEKSYYAIVDDSANILVDVKWDEFFVSGNDRPVWTRKETTFEVSRKTNVGVLAKMYYPGNLSSLDVAWRYMIVPADTQNVQFETSVPLYDGVVISGETCWEPYGYIIPLINKHIESCYFETADGKRYATNSGAYRLPDEIEEVKIEIPLDRLMMSGEIITMTSTGVAIPTYLGSNYLDVDLDKKPRVKIVYNTNS